jgi:hypothetical protein
MDRNSTKRTLERLSQKLMERGLDSLAAEERVALVSWLAFGAIRNGGFSYFYQGVFNIVETANSFRILGLEGLASACEASISAFPGRRIPADLGERQELVAHQIDWKPFAATEDVVYETKSDTVLDAIGSYIESNRNIFKVARPN